MTDGVGGNRTEAVACEMDGDGRSSVVGVSGEGRTTVAGVVMVVGEDVVKRWARKGKVRG